MPKKALCDVEADVCLVLEGTYPYVHGGVSSWVHELIKEQKHLTFTIVSIRSPGAAAKMCYDVPDNVVNIEDIYLQVIPSAKRKKSQKSKKLFAQIEKNLITLSSGNGSINALEDIIAIIENNLSEIGNNGLLDSMDAWNCLLSVYNKYMSNSAFIDFFWSWRSLLGGVYSVLLTEIPKAKTYHSLCTGYAGLYLARVRMKTGKPCFVTEHGIYTNERRIEILSADWLTDMSAYNLGVRADLSRRKLKDLWADMFCLYSQLCYKHSDKIITLYQGNQDFQLTDGAAPNKMMIVPNGIDVEGFQSIKRDDDHPPTVAFIGRVVPIKDVKTFIRACKIIKGFVDDAVFYLIGGFDEDIEYYEECVDLVSHEGMDESIIFTGKVNIKEYLGKIDVMMLTSVSEAQPLVILEAGAAGIPTVATNVGACKELILGDDNEKPYLGVGGAVVALSNPEQAGVEVVKLLKDKDYYDSCSSVIQKRVAKYYSKDDQHSAYKKIYDEMIVNGN